MKETTLGMSVIGIQNVHFATKNALVKNPYNLPWGHS